MKVIITRCENISSDHNNDPICIFNITSVKLKLQSFLNILHVQAKYGQAFFKRPYPISPPVSSKIENKTKK